MDRPFGVLAELTYSCPLACAYCSNPVNLAEYRDEQAASDQVLASVDPLGSPAWWPSFLGPEWNVAQIALHVVTETAAHAGHHDVVRESIDGTQWLVLDW